MKKRVVRFVEKSHANPTVIGGIRASDWEAAQQAPVLGNVDDWLEADLVVMHVDAFFVDPTRDWSVEGSWRTAYSRQTTFIIVRVTVGDRGAFEAAPHVRWEEAERVAFVLHVRNHGALEVAEDVRRAVLSMSPDQAKQVYEEDLDSLPEPLRRAFETPGVLSVLPALAVLCQGYLSLQDEGDAGVGAAQKLMGWRKELRIVEAEEEKRLRRVVVAPDFWEVLLKNPEDVGRSREALLENAQREWRIAGGVADAIPEPVSDLIDNLGDQMSSPSLVAKAYLALTKRLVGADVG